jgi:hypothetical protein
MLSRAGMERRCHDELLSQGNVLFDRCLTTVMGLVGHTSTAGSADQKTKLGHLVIDGGQVDVDRVGHLGRDDELILTHIDALRAALKECADELAEYMDFEHAIRDRYAIVNDKYERIAAAVRRARELLGDKP